MHKRVSAENIWPAEINPADVTFRVYAVVAQVDSALLLFGERLRTVGTFKRFFLR